MRVVSGEFLGRFQDGAKLFAPAAQAVASRSVSAVWSRLRTIDLTAALIACADTTEAGFRWIARAARDLMRNRGFGLTGGLVWRSLAALTGIGLTATLVTALSLDEGGPRLSTLTVAPAPELRPVRDVRLDPRPQAQGGDAWVRIARPIALFGLDSPELDKQPVAYEAARSTDGARRLDTLVFGGFASERPHLQMRALVENSATGIAAPFVIALVRDTAERGMSVQRSGVADAITTKFGAVETADATLSDGVSSRPCLAFRKAAGEGPLALSGWWCGSAARPADRQQLICLIDRLDLLSAGDDQALRAAFSRSELARQPACAPPRLSASGRKASWLDADGKPPALKTAAKR